MKTGFESVNIPEFDLEAFMKSITYPPVGMTVSLARAQIEKEEPDLSGPMREMKIMRRTMELIPIGINEDDKIAGNYGEKFTSPDFIKTAAAADEKEYTESVEYKVNSEEERLVSGRYMLFGIYTPSHTCVDYETIVTKGLGTYTGRIKERLNQDLDDYGREYLNAMLESIETAQIYALRFASLAEKLLEAEGSARRKSELERMIRALKKVPIAPAEDLFEALQSMWIIHTFTPTSERSWASVSLGRMDQYLLPYYEKWLAQGHSQKEAEDLFSEFFILLDSYGDGSGALNFGSDWTVLSQLLIDVEKRVQRRAPIIAVRMVSDTPNDVYDELIAKDLFKIGQPTFYGEKQCLDAMCYRGVSPKEDFSVNSCMGNVVVGEELADMWGCCINMNLALELAVNSGEPLHGELPASLRKYIDVKPCSPTDMEVIRKAYSEYTLGIVRYVADQNAKRAAWVALNRPNPFLSILLDDCIEFARDRAHSAVHYLGDLARDMLPEQDSARFDFEEVAQGRGAKYHNVTVLAMGFAHAADSLTAIEKLVFEEKKYTLDQIIEAARNNYAGSQQNMRILADLRHCPKYAENKKCADDNAAFVLNALADACEHSYRGNIRYLPSCHTIDANVQFGNCVYASMDGRRDGEPFGKNAGAVKWAIKTSPVELMLSCAKLPQKRYSGGVPIDIYVQDNILDKKENRDKFRDLLKTYFKMGGMQVQVNSVDIDLLKKAYAEPEKYPHVIVRKGGFSIYFTDMLRSVQKDMIERFEMETAECQM